MNVVVSSDFPKLPPLITMHDRPGFEFTVSRGQQEARLSLSVARVEASENTTPLFAHYFEAKVGRGCLLEYSIHSRAYTLPTIPHTNV